MRYNPIDRTLIKLFGQKKAELRSQGKKMSDFDLLIGCTAIMYDLIVVTNDQAFSFLSPLIKLENWSARRSSTA